MPVVQGLSAIQNSVDGVEVPVAVGVRGRSEIRLRDGKAGAYSLVPREPPPKRRWILLQAMGIPRYRGPGAELLPRVDRLQCNASASRSCIAQASDRHE